MTTEQTPSARMKLGARHRHSLVIGRSSCYLTTRPNILSFPALLIPINICVFSWFVLQPIWFMLRWLWGGRNQIGKWAFITSDFYVIDWSSHSVTVNVNHNHDLSLMLTKCLTLTINLQYWSCYTWTFIYLYLIKIKPLLLNVTWWIVKYHGIAWC